MAHLITFGQPSKEPSNMYILDSTVTRVGLLFCCIYLFHVFLWLVSQSDLGGV